MAWRGGVTSPNIREKQKRPSEDEREKIPKNQKRGVEDGIQRTVCGSNRWGAMVCGFPPTVHTENSLTFSTKRIFYGSI